MTEEIKDQLPDNLNTINENPQENTEKENLLLNNENPPSNNENNENRNSSKNKEEETSKNIGPCVFCHITSKNNNNYVFSNCNHQICPLCLFRRIFVRNLTDIGNLSNEAIEIKCKCEKGFLNKNIDELFEINNKKNSILTEQNKNNDQNDLENNQNLCENHSTNIINNYCITCSKNICDICLSESHNDHNIISNTHLLNSLKKDLKQIPLKFKSKENFESNWDEICNKIKKDTQSNLDEILSQIDDISTMLNEFKISIQEKYTYELTKIVKILKLYKLFFLDYYYEKKEAENTNNIDINILQYVNSIQYEIKDVNIIKNEKLPNKLNDIKTQIENLSSNEEEEDNIFNQKYEFEKVVSKFKIENFNIKAHEKLIGGLFQISDNKIITGGLDYSMKIWNADENGIENSQTMKGRCGAICCMAKLDNKKFFISAANNSNINLCEFDDEKNTINITQSLTSHTKAIDTMEILDDGKLVSGSLDNTMIVWEKDFNGNYIQVQEFKENRPIMKIIKLKNNKLAFTTDDGIIRILFEKKTIINNEVNKKYTIICKLTKHNGRVKSMCEMSNGLLLSGGADLGSRKDNNILVWKPNEFDGYFYSLTVSGHKSDVNNIIELIDGRIASTSKDRSVRIWKCLNDGNVINFEIEEILEDYPHGLYCIIQLNDGRLCTSTSDNSLVLWRSGNVFSYY